MADTTLEFTATYPSLDETAAAKQRDIERRAAILDEQERANATDVPGRAGSQTQPNPLVESVTTAFKAVGSGAQNTMQGLTELLLPKSAEEVAKQTPGEFLDSKVQAVRKTIVDGLVQIGAAPFIGMGAGAAQALENNWPELAKTEALDAGAAFTLRHILSGAPAMNAMQPDDIQAMRQPMMVKELLDLAVQSAPLAAGAARKVGQAAKIQAPTILGERGSFQRQGVGEVNTERVNAGARVKQIMTDLNKVVGESVLSQHREIISHGETIKQGQGWTLDNLLRLDPSTLTLEQGRAAQQATRDAFNASATTLSDLMKNVMSLPDEAANNKFLDQFATSAVLAGLDEWMGREFARGVEARKIISENKPPKKPPTGLEPVVVGGGSGQLLQSGGTHLTYEIRRGALHIIDLSRAAGIPSLKDLRLVLDAMGEQAQKAGVKTIEADVINPQLMELIKSSGIPITERNKVISFSVDDFVANRNLTPTAQPVAERPRKRATPGEGITTAAVLDVAEHLMRDPNVTAETLASALNNLTKRQQQHWLRQLWNGFLAGKDITFAAWIQSLLTGPVTHAVNIVGSAVGSLADIPERFTAEWLNAIRHNAPEGPQLGESARAVWALGQAYEDSIRLVGQAWRENKPPFEEAARERAGGTRVMIAGSHAREKTGEHHISAEQYGFDLNTGFGKFVETMGAALGSRWTPGASLMLEDAAMKGIPYRMELNAQAHRLATLEGLEGRAFETHRAFLEANPTKDMIAAAEDKAVLITLNQQLGTFGQWFTAGANLIPGGRVMFPFIRWSGNAIKWVNQRTPVLNTLSISNWSDFMAGGELQNKAIARWAVGNGVGAVIAYNVWQGNITGGANTKQQRALKIYQDCGPYSIRSGDTCIENYVRTLGQMGQMIGAVADYVSLVNEIPDQGTYELWVAHGEGIALALGQMFSNQPAMMQLANTLEVIKDPQSQSGKVAFGLARSVVPTGVRQVTRVMDDNIIREVRTIGDAIKSGLPLYVNDVEIHRNPVTGEALKYPEGVGPDIASPIFFTAKKNDPVFKEIVNTEANMPPLPWYVMGTNPGDEGARMTEPTGAEGIRLHADERDFWITQMTEKPGPGGQTLHEYLTEMVGSQRYQDQSKEGKAFMLRSAYNTYKTAAFAVLIDPDKGAPTLKERIERQLAERLSKMAPVTDPRSPQYGGTR